MKARAKGKLYGHAGLFFFLVFFSFLFISFLFSSSLDGTFYSISPEKRQLTAREGRSVFLRYHMLWALLHKGLEGLSGRSV